MTCLKTELGEVVLCNNWLERPLEYSMFIYELGLKIKRSELGLRWHTRN